MPLLMPDLEGLEEGTQYGTLPFDYYVIEHWPEGVKESPQQWEQLVWKYQALTLIERYSYHEKASSVLAQITTPDFTTEQIQILCIHQTINERNVCANEEGIMQTVWLRTNYDEDLSALYEEMKTEGDTTEFTTARYLDDSSRYAFDDGTPDHWRRALVHVPGITDLMGVAYEGDILQYRSCKNDDEIRAQCEALEEEDDRILALQELEFQVLVYLLDREAIETGLIKMLWLDEHGNSAWENRVDPGCLKGLAGGFLSATRLDEVTGGRSGRGSIIST